MFLINACLYVTDAVQMQSSKVDETKDSLSVSYGAVTFTDTTCKGLRERLGLDDIISVLQQNRLRWYGHVLRKEDSMENEVEGARPRGRPKKTWTEIVEKDCQVRGLNREDAVDRSRWRKQVRYD